VFHEVREKLQDGSQSEKAEMGEKAEIEENSKVI